MYILNKYHLNFMHIPDHRKERKFPILKLDHITWNTIYFSKKYCWALKFKKKSFGISLVRSSFIKYF